MRAILVGLLFIASLGAVPATGADDPIDQKDLVVAANRLKQIAIAFHVSHDVYQRLPGDIRDKEGKPLLSWRVAILPYIEEEKL